MAAAIGTLGKGGIGSASPVTSRFDYRNESLKMREELIDANGVRGTRSRSTERTRPGLRRVAGSISLQPNSLEMAYFLEWVMGGTPSGSPAVTYPLADTLPSRFVTFDRVAKVFTYAGCKVDVATFRASQGEPLNLDLQIVGTTETVGNAGTFPALSLDTTTQPFIFSDLALTIGASSSITAKDFELSINNMIDKDRFFTSLDLVSAEALDRAISLKCTLPYGDYTALYNAGGTGVAASATFTNGGSVLTMTMPAVRYMRESPETPGRVEIMLPITGTVLKSGSTAELSITLNPTP